MAIIDKIYTTYLALLTASLHKERLMKPNFVWPVQVWTDLFRLSQQQATLGVCYPVFGTLPKTQQPPQGIYLQWAAQANYIKVRNQKMQQALRCLQSLFAEIEVYPVVMKGLSFAMNYPISDLRMCGDIDLFIPERYEEAIEYLRGKEMELDYSEQHYALNYLGVRVELHHRVINTPFKEIDTYKTQDIHLESHDKTNHESLNFKVFDIETQAVLLLTHAAEHLAGPGISFRFLYDWAAFLQAHEKELNPISFNKQIRNYHLTRFTEVFTTAASELLGIPHPSFIKENHSWLLKALIKDLFVQGDCGQLERRKRLQRHKIVGIGMGIIRLIKFIPYSPYVAWNVLRMHIKAL